MVGGVDGSSPVEGSAESPKDRDLRFRIGIARVVRRGQRLEWKGFGEHVAREIEPLAKSRGPLLGPQDRATAAAEAEAVGAPPRSSTLDHRQSVRRPAADL